MMHRVILAALVLIAFVSPSSAEDPKPKSNAERLYFKVEICGELLISNRVSEHERPMLELPDWPVKARVVVGGMSMPLVLGQNKELEAAVQRLNGKLVVITGDLQRAEARTAIQGPFVDYIRVTSLKAAP